MRQVRQGIFETNSSSTHSITICTQEEYELFKNNELMYDSYEDKLTPYSSLLLRSESDRYKDHDHLGSNGGWWDLDTYTHSFTTPSGDKMVAFGTYGRDG